MLKSAIRQNNVSQIFRCKAYTMREALKWSSVKVDPVAVDAILAKNNLPYAIAQILVSRGIDHADKVQSFLTPRLASRYGQKYQVLHLDFDNFFWSYYAFRDLLLHFRKCVGV